MISICILASLLGVFVTADARYSIATNTRARAWEKEIRRGVDGVREGGEAFTVGSGPVALLLVHGFGSSPAVFSRMAPALAGRGYTCRAMRLPGYGEPVEAFSRVTREDWQQAVSAEAALLRKDHDRVWIVAHSMGGTLALREIADHPGAADGVVLVAPLLKVCARRSLGVPPRTLFRAADAVLCFTDVMEICFPVDASDPEVEELEGRDVFVPRSVYRELFALLDARPDAKDFPDVPLLMIVSRNDKVVDAAAAQEFFRAVPGDKRIVYADQAGHVIPLDHGWEEAVRVTDEFISAHERHE